MASWRFLRIKLSQRLEAWDKKHGKNLPDIGTGDSNALEDGEENGSFELSGSGQANGHERSARTEIVNGLGITRGASGGYDGGVSTKPASNTFDISNEVLGLLEVDPSFCTKAKHELLLIFAGI